MTPHTTNACPCDPARPVLYRLADGVTRLERRADAIAWGPLPVDEGRVLAFAQLQAGPWHQWAADAHTASDHPGDADTVVEIDLDDGGDLHIDWADAFNWGAGPDGIGSVARYRVLTPAAPVVGLESGGARSHTRPMPARRHRRHAGPWRARGPAACAPWWAM
ncbi:hypothetical protein [Ideonella sp. A 288]|uniref:hypothetical protein n=1 Tax=Ideonella sp. A 288 TaxID=1962181 RepID=UPI0011870843|nr:hypothetical protein [Ideonella sp. A 288]